MLIAVSCCSTVPVGKFFFDICAALLLSIASKQNNVESTKFANTHKIEEAVL